MKRISAVLNRPVLVYQNLGLRKKLLIVYFLVIAAPFGLFAMLLINQTQERVHETQLSAMRQTMQGDVDALARRVTQLESYALMFQNDKRMIEYLSLRNQTVADEIISFITELYPLFASVYTLDPEVAELAVHSVNKPLTPLPTHILYSEDNLQKTEALPMRGQWCVEVSEGKCVITFSTPLYNHNYTRRLGFLEIGLWDGILQEYLSSGQYVRIGGEWHQLGAEGLVQSSSPLASSQSVLYCEQSIPGLNIDYVSVLPKNMAGEPGSYRNLLLVMALLFIIFSALYYLFLFTLSSRLSKLATHITKTRYGNLEEFKENPGADEIGQVITQYNQMILRIGGLLSEINIAQLQEDQARYFALQAQIQPHFLYNAMETARMMAESAGNEGVADFIYNVGVFVRYSFTSFESDVPLTRELDIVGKYLQIYKATMGARMEYEVIVGPGLECLRCPPFMIQPLVENSVRHGIREDGQPLHILVGARLEKDALEVVVKDNGAGISPEVLRRLENPPDTDARGHGLGITNVMKRVKNYYAGSGAFAISSELGMGTTCTISGKGGRK
ncbi:MAG: histidine kinase [Clostridiales bacterium]|jgi:two-component system sensor histidine kinase YesM|nr:histidine kinase [Clostridiales bacterium]